jgi:hypothetical protein
LNANLENGIEKIKERCSLLKHQIQIKAESLIDKKQTLSDEMQKKIDKYKIECIESIEKSKEIKERIKAKVNEGSLFYETSSKYISQLTISDNEVASMSKNATNIFKDLKKSKIDLKRLMLANKCAEFKENDTKLNSEVLGWIEDKTFHLDSLILNDDQKVDLFELWKSNISNISSSEWSLIYRASRDGRSAQAFHSKCNNKAKTLTVVKSTDGYIFGGYADQTWSSSNKFKLDLNAYIFSLVNPWSKSDLGLNDVSQQNTKGIYCHPIMAQYF